MEINQNVYVYGKFYDSGKEKNPSETSDYDLIIYAQPSSGISRTIGSLEGFFVSTEPLIKKGDKGVRKGWNPIVQREEMRRFEEEYKGKFYPFEE